MKILTPQYLEAILYRLGARDFDVAPIYDPIFQGYNDSNHVYHSEENHIEPGLKVIHEHILKTEHPNVLMCAWIFHDLVMDSTRHDNEEKSAELCADMLCRINVPESKVDEVKRLILATKHDKPVYDSDQRLVCDVDLYFIAPSFPEFLENTEKIRQEYGTFSDEEFARGRVEFLQTFLRRDKIFQTDELHKLYEKKARYNLRASLRLLRRQYR